MKYKIKLTENRRELIFFMKISWEIKEWKNVELISSLNHLIWGRKTEFTETIEIIVILSAPYKNIIVIVELLRSE